MVVFFFSLFSITLFCAEKSPTERTKWDQYKERRNRLMGEIKNQNPDVENGIVVLFSHFEDDTTEFKQESNFYYLTGVKEPGTILLLNFAEKSVLYIPNNLKKRSSWTPVQRELVQKNTEQLGFGEILELEGAAQGPYFEKSDRADLCERLSQVTQEDGTVFTLKPMANTPAYVSQDSVLKRLEQFVPNSQDHVKNISSILFSMRQVKDEQEIECLRKAVAITIEAQKAAAQTIQAGITECKVRGTVDGTMYAEGSRPGFFSIIGSGNNSTVLHNPASSKIMDDGELVIVDIGAECPCHFYSGDLTRTYPVSGKFSKEQRVIYSIVLGALQRVTESTRPGYYLSNKKDESRSLAHIAKKFFDQHNYGEYFTHGIGHHIFGGDVHGDCVENPETFSHALRANNVVALEPGLYLSKEVLKEKFGKEFECGFGVRIESNYLITEDGAVCLDEALPKDPELDLKRHYTHKNRFRAAMIVYLMSGD